VTKREMSDNLTPYMLFQNDINKRLKENNG